LIVLKTRCCERVAIIAHLGAGGSVFFGIHSPASEGHFLNIFLPGRHRNTFPAKLFPAHCVLRPQHLQTRPVCHSIDLNTPHWLPNSNTSPCHPGAFRHVAARSSECNLFDLAASIVTRNFVINGTEFSLTNAPHRFTLFAGCGIRPVVSTPYVQRSTAPIGWFVSRGLIWKQSWSDNQSVPDRMFFLKSWFSGCSFVRAIGTYAPPQDSCGVIGCV